MTDYLARRDDVALAPLVVPEAPTDPPELTAYRRQVRRAALSLASENDYCIETVNDYLRRVDLPEFQAGEGAYHGIATVTGYYRQDAPVLTEEEAKKMVIVRTHDPDVSIDSDRPREVLELHEDRIVMTAHVKVRNASSPATATRWALSALELHTAAGFSMARVLGRDPLFDHSNVTKIEYTETPKADPDADCWDGDDD